MEGNPLPTATQDAETVVASIDPAVGGEEYVIADISTDGAWVSMNVESAPALAAWR
ncbi:hypothetical protein Halru_3101 [Halovivax ruber XH-70]|uniref:Uncharacterized protein n=1 Tax=Halovivax ruber (strain DSM 18193 / JCM 13892 / XH-70) TaxID=797302 RepID=L0II57_HALRX|nr:hypothetical protein [Halovivax ruber]AGB17667.1 hypothetical protein Halru_3101 [Halovivax ruber XH-70]